MTEELVLTDVRADGVATLRLNRPPMNALSQALLGQIAAAALAFAADDDGEGRRRARWRAGVRGRRGHQRVRGSGRGEARRPRVPRRVRRTGGDPASGDRRDQRLRARRWARARAELRPAHRGRQGARRSAGDPARDHPGRGRHAAAHPAGRSGEGQGAGVERTPGPRRRSARDGARRPRRARRRARGAGARVGGRARRPARSSRWVWPSRRSTTGSTAHSRPASTSKRRPSSRCSAPRTRAPASRASSSTVRARQPSGAADPARPTHILASSRCPYGTRTTPNGSRVDAFGLRPEAGEVGAPEVGEDRPAGLLADGSAHPPRVAQLLVPAQLGHPAGERVQREPALSGDDAAVLDAHHHARSPLGDRHDVRGRERPHLGQALELGADARPLLAAERDRDRVRHPLGVRLEVLHRGPDRVRRDADGLGQPDLDRHDALASRRRAAAELGGDRVDEDAGPLLEPGDERGARQHVRVPVELARAPARRRGADHHVVRARHRARAWRGASASRNEIATTRTSASVASSNRARVDRWATRMP